MDKKVITSGLIAGVAMLVTAMVLNRIFAAFFPSVAEEYLNTSLFRPWSDPLMSYMFVHPFVLGIVLAWVWDKTKALFKEREVFWKCCQFTFAYWVITIPGMLISYSTFPISFAMVLTWSLSILVESIVAGLVFVKMNP